MGPEPAYKKQITIDSPGLARRNTQKEKEAKEAKEKAVIEKSVKINSVIAEPGSGSNESSGVLKKKKTVCFDSDQGDSIHTDSDVSESPNGGNYQSMQQVPQIVPDDQPKFRKQITIDSPDLESASPKKKGSLIKRKPTGVVPDSGQQERKLHGMLAVPKCAASGL